MSYILNIPEIEDDELMGSFFRRMADANGFKDPLFFMQSYIWPNSVITIRQSRTIRDDGFNELTNFSKCFGDRASAIDFFLKTSLYTGIRPVISNANTIVLYVFRDNTDDISIVPKKYVRKPRFCPACAKNDHKEKGYSWFRRSHNMPGVKVCFKHNCYLRTEIKDQDILYCNDPLEIKYANFAHEMILAAVDCDHRQTIEVIKNKITELGYDIPTGGYSEFVSVLDKGDYKGFMPDNTEYVLKTGKNSVVNSDTCEVMLKLLFVLFDTPNTFKQYIRYDNTFSSSGYTITEYRDGLYQLVHKCGSRFVITKELFDKGFRCPCLKSKSKEKNLTSHIKEACKDQYEVIGFDGPNVTLFHKVCKKKHKYNIGKFVLGSSRCQCERRKPINDVKTDIESVKGFKLISYTGVNDPLQIEHTQCGKTFFVGYYTFMKAPYCRACYQSKIGVDIKITPRSSKKSSETSFIQDITDIVGDEYNFVGPYNGDDAYTYIKHNKCGTIEKYIPSHFRQGMRCKRCAVKTSYEGFKQYVHDLTNGEYEIVAQGINRYLVIKNTLTGDEYSLQKNIIMQELNRVRPSQILPTHNRQNVDIVKYGLKRSISYHNTVYKIESPEENVQNYMYRTESTWKYIQDHFQKTDLFGEKDIHIENTGLWILAKTGKIKKVITGIYTFPENNAEAMDVIRYRYFQKYGIRFGYWFGQSFAYHLGLINKPETVYIATNKMQINDRHALVVLGQPVILRKPVDEITEENYKVLAVIDYITTYKNGFRGTKKTDFQHEITALRHYVKDIRREQFDVYADKCIDKNKLGDWLDLIYVNGSLDYIKTEFSTNELFSPDDAGVSEAEMSVLVKAKELKKVYRHLYAFPEKRVTVEDIIKYKYVEHHGIVLGYWYGKSFLYQLGISEKPQKYYIASFAYTENKNHYRGVSENFVLDQIINIRRPLVEITKDNYAIVCVIDLISEYGIGRMNKTYFYPYEGIDLESVLTALAKFLHGSKIKRSDFVPYSYLAKNPTLLSICLDMIYMHDEFVSITENFKKNEIFKAEDIGYPNEVLWAYSRTGRIKNIYKDLFALDSANITDEDIINYKYLERNGLRIGYWFGRSFTYHLGLVEKPSDYKVVSNVAIDKKKSFKREVSGNKIRVHSPIAAVTEDNYKILCVIDYVTIYRMAFYDDEHIDVQTDVEALRQYAEGIPRSAYKKYEPLCKSKKLLNEWLDKIYGEI